MRPDPKTYLTPKEIEDHLALFKGGVARFQLIEPIGAVGYTETWVLPRSTAEDIIKRANGDAAILEDLLEFDSGYLGLSPVLVEVKDFHNLRVSTGQEHGANDKWDAGGYTRGGLPEAIIDPVPIGSYICKPVF